MRMDFDVGDNLGGIAKEQSMQLNVLFALYFARKAITVSENMHKKKCVEHINKKSAFKEVRDSRDRGAPRTHSRYRRHQGYQVLGLEEHSHPLQRCRS